MSTFGGLDTLFNPAKRHLDEEKLRLQSTREEVGDASGGKRIDLDSGRVKITRTARAGADVAAADAAVVDVAVAGEEPDDAPAVATTQGHVRSDAEVDADPAAPGD